MAFTMDENGDTPLHAAVSADNIQCVELLLNVLSTSEEAAIAAPSNKLLMTPAHLAASIECLNALYSFGADLTVVDATGRSPLFVACAMNRSELAEYLVGCLDQEMSSLYIQDNRGDTPLHAAACNGALDCLLLLLQYGVDPTITNIKGFKPVDLAILNHHKECQTLLNEYHLHFSTNSDFDSVLFLATLQVPQLFLLICIILRL
jgi:ankyrin repeat protein